MIYIYWSTLSFLFIYSRIHASEGSRFWFPNTLVYAEMKNEPFEIFAKSQMKKHCAILLKMFNVDSIDKFRSVILNDDAINNFRLGMMPSIRSIHIKQLIGLDKLATT